MKVKHSPKSSVVVPSFHSSHVDGQSSCASSSLSIMSLCNGDEIVRSARPIDEANIACVRIREVIVADKSLSLYAHNIDIIYGRGSVTLKGYVKSEAEREKIGLRVATVISVGTVINELIVRSKRSL